MSDTQPIVLSTVGGHRATSFVEQFNTRAATGDPVQLLVYLNPTLAGERLAEVVAGVVCRPGVVETRWVNMAGLPVLSDSLRTALAGFEVRVMQPGVLGDLQLTGEDGGAARPVVALFNRVDKLALISVIAHTEDGREVVDQETLDLASLVDQAIRRVYERADDGYGRELDLADIEPAVRCTRCRRLTAAGEQTGEELEALVGEICGQPVDGEACGGVLRPVMLTVAPRASAAEAQPA